MARSSSPSGPAQAPLARPIGRLGTRTTLLTLVLLAVLVHLPVLVAEYVQDDHLAIEQNAIVERGDLGEILSTSYWEGAAGRDRSLYRPVVIGSYALERTLAGGVSRPAVSHAVNVVIHVGVVLLLWLTWRRLGGGYWEATAAASLFAVHPVHTEAVANVVGRAELMAAFFALGALAALAVADPWADRPGARRLAWLSGGALLLALGAKETAIAVPPLMALLALWKRAPADATGPERWLPRVGLLLPGFAAGLLYIGLRARALGDWIVAQPVPPIDNVLVTLDGIPRLATALSLVVRYAGLLLVPLRLSADYSGPVLTVHTRLLSTDALLGLLLLSILTLAALLGALRGRSRNGGLDAWRRLSLAALVFLLPYLIIGNLLFDVGAGIAERFLYLPSIGFCLGAGMLLGTMESGRVPHLTFQRRTAGRFMTASLVAWLGALSILTFERSREWKNDETIFRAVVRDYPDSPRGQFVLGKLAADDRRHVEAMVHLRRTVELAPDHFSAWSHIGKVQGELDRLDEAERTFRRTLELAPQSWRDHLNLAMVLRRKGRLPAAERSLQKSLAWNGRSANTWAEMGNLMLQWQRYERAAEAYRVAIRLGRTDLDERLRIAERGLAEGA